MASSVRKRFSPRLQVFVSLVWACFLFWSVLALWIFPWTIGVAHVERAVGDPAHSPLAAALVLVLQYFDLTWVLLGAASLYFSMISQEGIAVARRWSGLILGGAAVLAFLNAATGWPLGGFVYTNRLGLRLMGWLPLGVPLLWYLLVAGSRYTVLAFWPGAAAARWKLAGAGALLVGLADLNLEPFALFVRYYWRWPLGVEAGLPGIGNFLAWMVLAFALLWAMPASHRPTETARAAVFGGKRPWLEPPVVIFVSVQLVFLVTHLLR